MYITNISYPEPMTLDDGNIKYIKIRAIRFKTEELSESQKRLLVEMKLDLKYTYVLGKNLMMVKDGDYLLVLPDDFEKIFPGTAEELLDKALSNL